MVDPTDEDVERVMALACPDHLYEEQCRSTAIISLWEIARPISDLVPRGVVRKRLKHLATTLNSARAEIKAIPEGWLYHVFDGEIERNDFLLRLTKIEGASEKLAGRMVVERSGGAKRDRENAERQRIAADYAFDLLNDYGGPSPTQAAGGTYFALASLLFEIATGQEDKDLSRACRDHVKALERDGFPDAKMRQRMKRHEKNQPPPPDHILRHHSAAKKKTDREK
jgi:hypothetical protein